MNGGLASLIPIINLYYAYKSCPQKLKKVKFCYLNKIKFFKIYVQFVQLFAGN